MPQNASSGHARIDEHPSKRYYYGMTDPARLDALRPTLRDVARVASVSLATASMALRDDPRTAVATRERVRAAAAKLNYVPDSQARGLRARRSGNLGLVIPHSSEHVFSHPYFSALLNGIVERCNQAGSMLVLSISPVEHDERTPYLRVLHGRSVDGAIVASASLRDRNVLQLGASGYPAVFIGRYPDSTTVDAVGVDDRGGASLATDHLIAVHGRTRVAHLRGPANALSALDRFEGYRDALSRHLLPFQEELVVSADYDERSGREACARLLASAVPFDGIFAANDDSAIGSLRVLTEAGIRVPQGVSIVGFDDGPLASIVSPGLTTVSQPIRELGRTAATRLLDLIDSPRGSGVAVQTILPVELVVRGSCGCGA